jgi:hypothetical protein
MHIGIFGPTRGGKTTLANALLAQKKKAGFANLVCDPLLVDLPREKWGQVWPGAVWITTDISEFIDKARRCKRCFLFVEESSLSVKRCRDVSWLFVAAGNPLAGGHTTVVIGQDASSLLPGMRQQLSTVYLFRCHPDLAEVWSYQFADPEIVKIAPKLNRFEFITCETYRAKPLAAQKLSGK